MFRNEQKLHEKHISGPSGSRKSSKTVMFHNCRGFDHVKSECPSSRRYPDKAMNATFTYDESNSNN